LAKKRNRRGQPRPTEDISEKQRMLNILNISKTLQKEYSVGGEAVFSSTIP
jgi:hypothetical protein